VDHAQPLASSTAFPWRAVAVVCGGVALVELVALIAIGLVHLAPKATSEPAAPARTTAKAVVHVAVPRAPKVRNVPLRPRGHTRVLVLNGNGVTGAASMQASSLRIEGYSVAGATDAPRHDYARTMVMFIPGWQKEARRLAHDVHVRMVAPLDGLRRAQLHGAKIILLLGN
jgi:hypothetical protein